MRRSILDLLTVLRETFSRDEIQLLLRLYTPPEGMPCPCCGKRAWIWPKKNSDTQPDQPPIDTLSPARRST